MAIEIADLNRATSTLKSSRRTYRLSSWLLYLGIGGVIAWFAARDGVVFVPRGADPANYAGRADSIASGFGVLALGLLLIVASLVLRLRSKKKMAESASVLRGAGLV